MILFITRPNRKVSVSTFAYWIWVEKKTSSDVLRLRLSFWSFLQSLEIHLTIDKTLPAVLGRGLGLLRACQRAAEPLPFCYECWSVLYLLLTPIQPRYLSLQPTQPSSTLSHCFKLLNFLVDGAQVLRMRVCTRDCGLEGEWPG